MMASNNENTVSSTATLQPIQKTVFARQKIKCKSSPKFSRVTTGKSLESFVRRPKK
jgi:hypothetical protein